MHIPNTGGGKDQTQIIKKYFYKSDLIKNDCACQDEEFRFAPGCVDPNLKFNEEGASRRRMRERELQGNDDGEEEEQPGYLNMRVRYSMEKETYNSNRGRCVELFGGAERPITPEKYTKFLNGTDTDKC